MLMLGFVIILCYPMECIIKKKINFLLAIRLLDVRV